MKTRVISVTSGKGGVGKTSLTANMAALFAKRGRKVLVLDGDFGLANIDTLIGQRVDKTLHDVVTGSTCLEDIVIPTKAGFHLIPSSSGIFELTELDDWGRREIISQLEEVSEKMDLVLIDTGAGINRDVLFLNAASQRVIMITTPDPTSITDSYALMKVLSQQRGVRKFSLITNQVRSDREGEEIYHKLLDVTGRFLNVSIEHIGSVTEDAIVKRSVRRQELFSINSPTCTATLSLARIVEELAVSRWTPPADGGLRLFWKDFVNGSPRENEFSFI